MVFQRFLLLRLVVFAKRSMLSSICSVYLYFSRDYNSKVPYLKLAGLPQYNNVGYVIVNLVEG